MADTLKEIENYVSTQWHNYLPPSIDQDKLNHLEDNVNLNRDTINDIIRHLGIKPSGTSAEDSKIYENPIYQTLIDQKNRIKNLENNKLDKSSYNTNLGDFTKLQGGSNLVDAINNRLRKDRDDTSEYSYTFKKLILTDTGASVFKAFGGVEIGKNLSVGGNSTLTGNLTVNSTITSKGLTVNGSTKLNGALNATGKITGTGGMAISGGGSVTGTLTVDKLIVTGDIEVRGNASFRQNLTASSIDATSTITANGDIRTRSYFYSSGEMICFHWEQSPLHRLYVHGGTQGLESGDAFIQTVT